MSKRSLSGVPPKSQSSNHLTTNQIPKFHQTKSQFSEQLVQQEFPQSHATLPLWYLNSREPQPILPPYFHLNKNSDPFKFTITQITGINIPKKSSNSQQYVHISAYFLTDQLDTIGSTIEYQCQLPIMDGKLNYNMTHSNKQNIHTRTKLSSANNNNICLYYHSRIDKNSPHLRLIIRFSLYEIRVPQGIVQNCTQLGVSVIQRCLIEDQVKNCIIYKDHSQVQLVTGINESGMKNSGSSSTITFSYNIQSNIQLKSIVKFIPSETIITSQVEVTGILDSFADPDYDYIEQQVFGLISIKDFQIHIPEKYQNQILTAYKNINHLEGSQLPTVKRRQVITGFHNQYKFVSPSFRNLEFLGKESTGQYNINVYELLGEGEQIKIPYYIVGQDSVSKCALAFSLLYQFEKSTQVEIAIFSISPTMPTEYNQHQNTSHQVSETMLVGPGKGLYSTLLQVNSKKLPTIMFDYEIQIPQETERRGLEAHEDNSQSLMLYSNSRLKSHHKFGLKSDKKLFSQHQIRAQTKALEQVQRQRLRLQKQREHLEYLKTQQNFNIQEEYEKKFEQERDQLKMKQMLLQEQYREQVQRQIRRKIELQQQILMMKERLAMIQQGNKLDMGGPSKRMSYEVTPPMNIYENNADYHEHHPHHPQIARNKVLTNYLIPENNERSIPVAEVRDILAQQPLFSTLANNKELIQKEYNQFNFASKFTFAFSSIIWSEEVIHPPKSFFMVIRFFNFKQFRTDALTYIEESLQHGHYHKLIKLSHYSYSHQNSSPLYTFTVDPSCYAAPHLVQQDLTDYLINNNAIVDIFDAQNHIYIGQINIRLGELLRNGKSQVLIAKQYNIVRVKSQQNYGVLQLLIKNEQTDTVDEISPQEKKRTKDMKKKVVSNNPIPISKQIQNTHIISSNKGIGSEKQSLNKKLTTRSRLEQRIENYKKKTAQEKEKNALMPKFGDFDERQKGNMINKIHQYKQKKMPEYIRKMYEQLLTETITINPYFGQSKTFIYEFTNLSQSPSTFRVNLQQQGDQLCLVKNSAEWKHYVHVHGYARPKVYECINDEDCFYLGAGESIPLCFKYLSFQTETETNYNPSSNRQPNKKLNGTTNFVHSMSNTINVSIIKQQNNWIIGGFTLNVNPHSSIVNHSYILYQPGAQLIDLIMPVIYSSADSGISSGSNGKRLYLTIEDAEADWLSEYEILLRIKSAQIMSKVKFNMLLYQDQYFDKLKENWLIQLHAYEGVCAYMRPDDKTKFKICIPQQIMAGLHGHTVLKLHSSHPQLVFEEEELQGVRLGKGGPVEIWCQLIGNGNWSGNGEIQVTCTNQSHQLVYGWAVQVYVYVPRRA